MTTFRGRSPAALAFGTSGLRGLVTDITDLEAYINTRGFLDYVVARDGKVSVAGDLRPSTDRILCAVAKAIEDAGCVVENLGKIPTPALTFHGIEHRRPHVMVTGSHIPFDRNGIKFGKPAGEALKDDEAGILAAVAKVREVEYGRSADASPFADDGMLKEPVALPAVNDRGAARAGRPKCVRILALGIGILPLFTDRFDPEVRVRTTAYERMYERPVMADCNDLHLHDSENLNGRFRRKPPFRLDQFAHCLYCPKEKRGLS